MDKLNFLGSLDEEQKQNAEKVARFAVEAGVDPYLAVAIAYKEGSLRTNTPRGKSGEIGMMQVMPKTGMGLGYDEKKLSNPNQNIKAGVQYLKQGLQAAENSPELAAIYYNGGPGALEALRTGKEPDPRVFDYVRALNGYGTFGAAEAAEAGSSNVAPGGEAPGEDGLTLVGAPPPEPKPAPYTDTSTADPRDRMLYGLVGAGTGTAFTGRGLMKKNDDANAVRRAGLEERARIQMRRDEANARTALLREQQAAERLAALKAANPANAASTAAGVATPAAGVAAPAGTPPGGLTGGSGPTPQAVRVQQGTTKELGVTGRQSGEGYNTETSQRAAGKNVATDKVDVLKNLGVVGQDATEFFAAQHGLTTTPSGVLYPRSEPAPTTGARPPQPFQTRTGPKSGLNIPPVPKAVVPAAPPPIPSVLAGAVPDDLSLRPPAPPKSGLAAVNDMFTKMIRPLEPAANAAGRALKPLLGPFAGVSTGLDVAELAHEMNKPADQQSLGKIFLKGASAGTGALSMIPGPQQRITVPAALGSSALYEMLYNEELKNYIRNKLGMEPQVTP